MVHRLLQPRLVKRIRPPPDRFALALSLLLTLLLASALPGAAADATPAGAKTAQPKAEGKADAAGSQQETGKAKNAATDEKKEDAEMLLIELFKKEESITNSLGMVMVWVPAGYRIGQHEVSQLQYQEIMKDNPSKFPGPQHPVENVALEEAMQFCKQLTEKESQEGKIPKGYYYSVPSEQQWEYYVDEADLKDSVTGYYGDRQSTENVGIFPPNKFGLYDTRGNVWDLCDNNVGRGGSFRSNEDWVFLKFRYVVAPGQRYDDIGFRIVLQGEAQRGEQAPATASQKPTAAKSY